MEYAEHHKIVVPVGEYLEKQIGKETVSYGALSEDEAKNASLSSFLQRCVQVAVRRDLQARAGGITLSWTRPLADKLDGMFVLWTNYDTVERDEEIEEQVGVDAAIDAIEGAMKEAGFKPELLWYYDWLELPEQIVRTFTFV